MAMLDLDDVPDRKRHPHTLFGQPKTLLQKFVAATDDSNAGYKRMLPKLHDILRLSDEIQRAMADELGKLKISEKKGNRVAPPRNKDEPAYFAGGKIGGHIPLGWLYPIMAAFRANVDRKAWAAGNFAWLANPFEILWRSLRRCAV
jgi:hypothetical protein